MEKSRREFIKKTGLAAGITIMPFENIFVITKPAKEDNPVIGHGEYKYKVDKSWGFKTLLNFL